MISWNYFLQIEGGQGDLSTPQVGPPGPHIKVRKSSGPRYMCIKKVDTLKRRIKVLL